jgi:eukaryotic-like serine/threonine-protein kinase
VLAQLNHPNIATIHGLERSGTSACLVMELVPGETLAARIARGRIPVDEALPIATQIAQALEAAHDKGIVHRDLKPANIVVAPDHNVKVLDFGLAKDVSGGRQADLTASPTIAAGTMAGVILGTAAYMSPEQARGRAVDKRTDIWSFGCVLFEMLAGKAAFGGETLTDIVAEVVKNEPDWSHLPPDLSPAVRSLLRRCLQKDSARRLHDAADARIELEDASGHDSASGIARPRTRFPRSGSWLPAAAVVAAAVVIAGFLISRSLQNRSPPLDGGVKRFAIAMPSGTLISDVTLSADGQQLVYVLGSDRSQLGGGDRSQLYHCRLD